MPGTQSSLRPYGHVWRSSVADEDGVRDCGRQIVGADRTPASEAAARSERRAASGPGPSGPSRHPLRSSERHPLADASPGHGLRQRHDLLAPAARLERGRGVAQVAPGRARRATSGSGHQTGRAPRWTPRAYRQKRGRRHRPESDRSRQAGLEAPCHGRRAGASPRDQAWPCERARFQAVRGTARRRAARAWPPWAAAEASGQAARRQGLRFPALPTSLPRPKHHSAHRTPRVGVTRAARPVPLDRRENARVAPSVSTPRCSI